MQHELDLYARDNNRLCVGDQVELDDQTITTIKGATKDMIEHTGGFCYPNNVVRLVRRAESRPAYLIVNAGPLTKVRPTPNYHMPVQVTQKTEVIDGVKHRECIIGRERHMVMEFFLKHNDELYPKND